MRALDVVVAGAGPAGSVAALASSPEMGARVALVDKAAFPRDKACGDLIGPRGVQALADLGIALPDAMVVGDMVVVGPNGRQVRLPCFPGITYPDHALALSRRQFDDTLRLAALDAGARWVHGRVQDVQRGDGGGATVTVDDRPLRADFVVGADGATSRVASATGLVENKAALWGFAVRAYRQQSAPLPKIFFWEKQRGRALPGYGWEFPGPQGANVGFGIGMLGDRTRASMVPPLFSQFLDTRTAPGPAASPPHSAATPPSLGGWLKFGMAGTCPARHNVLLVGDAAGLVNPLQGEGIAHAITSGRAAAEAIVTQPGTAADRYRAVLTAMHSGFAPGAAAIHRLMVGHPRVVAVLGRILTAPVPGELLAGGWSLYWNELTEGAEDSRAQRLAGAATWASRLMAGGRRASPG